MLLNRIYLPSLKYFVSRTKHPDSSGLASAEEPWFNLRMLLCCTATLTEDKKTSLFVNLTRMNFFISLVSDNICTSLYLFLKIRFPTVMENHCKAWKNNFSWKVIKNWQKFQSPRKVKKSFKFWRARTKLLNFSVQKTLTIFMFFT